MPATGCPLPAELPRAPAGGRARVDGRRARVGQKSRRGHGRFDPDVFKHAFQAVDGADRSVLLALCRTFLCSWATGARFQQPGLCVFGCLEC